MIKYFFLVILFIGFLGTAKISKGVEYNVYSKAKIQILNKVTGKVKVYDLPINTILNVDDKLSIIVKACHKATQRYSPEDVMFLQVAKAHEKVDVNTAFINNTKILNKANFYINKDKNLFRDEKNIDNPNVSLESKLIFSGWIFSNHPDISSLADPHYDITIVKCFN